MYKRHWWRFWQPVRAGLPPISIRQPDGTTLQVHAMEMPAGESRGATSWDLTFGAEGEDGSYVVALAGIRMGANGYLLGRYRDRPNFPMTIVAIRNFKQRFPDLAATLVEEKANGKAAIDTLRSAIPGMIPQQPRGSKEVRAEASTPRVEAGNWHLPHPLLPGAEWVQEFIDELASFPTGTNDDQVDAFGQLDRYLFGNSSPTITEPRGILAQWLAEQ
jgi:predicted phage terminase large subunit-like protein